MGAVSPHFLKFSKPVYTRVPPKSTEIVDFSPKGPFFVPVLQD
jgi:hypothetical protein